LNIKYKIWNTIITQDNGDMLSMQFDQDRALHIEQSQNISSVYAHPPVRMTDFDET